MCCTECGMTSEQHIAHFKRPLEVHRTTPGSVYSLEPGACVTLCRACHGPKPKSRHKSGRSDGVGGYVLTIPVSADLRNALDKAATDAGTNAIDYARLILMFELPRWANGFPKRS